MGVLYRQPLRELREFLEGLFEPSLKDVYQRVQVLPGLDEIDVDPGRLTLVITAPRPGGADSARYDSEPTYSPPTLTHSSSRASSSSSAAATPNWW